MLIKGNSAPAFRLGTLVRGSALALAVALLAGPVHAQDSATGNATAQTGQATPESEEVVVTGIRQSLSSAAGLKRNSEIVMDSITSEDLGKFPDANIAESLQRIPGVSIDRNNGEGQFVTVRGLGPAFNTVLFNGRSFASDNYGREFSFDLLAASPPRAIMSRTTRRSHRRRSV